MTMSDDERLAAIRARADAATAHEEAADLREVLDAAIQRWCGDDRYDGDEAESALYERFLTDVLDRLAEAEATIARVEAHNTGQPAATTAGAGSTSPAPPTCGRPCGCSLPSSSSSSPSSSHEHSLPCACHYDHDPFHCDWCQGWKPLDLNSLQPAPFQAPQYGVEPVQLQSGNGWALQYRANGNRVVDDDGNLRIWPTRALAKAAAWQMTHPPKPAPRRVAPVPPFRVK